MTLKKLNNYEEQYENFSIVAGHSDWKWGEISRNWTDIKWNKGPDPAETLHTGTAASVLCSENKLWLGCCDTIYCLVNILVNELLTP